MSEQIVASSEDMSYGGFCGDCGRLVYAIVDSPDRKRDVAKGIAEAVRDGCRVERMTCDAVRKAAWGCTADCGCKFCVKKRAKLARTAPEKRSSQLSLDGAP